MGVKKAKKFLKKGGILKLVIDPTFDGSYDELLMWHKKGKFKQVLKSAHKTYTGNTDIELLWKSRPKELIRLIQEYDKGCINKIGKDDLRELQDDAVHFQILYHTGEQSLNKNLVIKDKRDKKDNSKR